MAGCKHSRRFLVNYYTLASPEEWKYLLVSSAVADQLKKKKKRRRKKKKKKKKKEEERPFIVTDLQELSNI